MKKTLDEFLKQANSAYEFRSDEEKDKLSERIGCISFVVVIAALAASWSACNALLGGTDENPNDAAFIGPILLGVLLVPVLIFGKRLADRFEEEDVNSRKRRVFHLKSAFSDMGVIHRLAK